MTPAASIQPQFLQLLVPQTAALAAEAAAGLVRPHAELSPKFFYDSLGSRIFDAITELDEYYPTRTEAAIVRAQLPTIAQMVQAALGASPSLVDLGAGNCAKAATLFEALQPSRYLALDFSTDFLRVALQGLQQQYPAIRMTGVGLDFSSHLTLPAGLLQGPALLLYPGSSIGNFNPADALRFLTQARELSAGGGLLIGVDRVKPMPVLEAAYDDALGVTAAFNLNLLRHVNRLLGADFQPRQWRHVARFNTVESRIEMHLQAMEAVVVRWPGGERRFAAGERIHTENSYKWRLDAFEALLREAGFARVQSFTDAQGWFAVCLAFAR